MNTAIRDKVKDKLDARCAQTTFTGGKDCRSQLLRMHRTNCADLCFGCKYNDALAAEIAELLEARE